MTLLSVAIAIDQLCNAVLAGEADETISARAYRNRESGKRRWRWGHKGINWLFFWQPAHCMRAYEAEMLRKQLPKEYR